MLTAIHQVQRRQPSSRVGGYRRQHRFQPRDQGLDRGRFEHIGAKLHPSTDAVEFSVLRDPVDQEEGKIHSGGVGVDRHRGDLQVTRHETDGRVVVLPVQNDLDQRVMGPRAGRVESIHQHLERHVLVFVGGQAALARLGKQLSESRVAVEVDPQHQGVDEEPHQRVERGITSAGNRKAHRDIGSGAQPG